MAYAAPVAWGSCVARGDDMVNYKDSLIPHISGL